MKSKVVVCVIVALFCAKVHAQQCYQCITVSSDEVELNMSPAPASCYGPFKIVNCTQPGACVTGHYIMDYNLTGTGRVGVEIVVHNCIADGAPADGLVGDCLGDAAFQQEIATQRDVIDGMVPKGAEFLSANGEVCYCSSNLCNGRKPTVVPTTVATDANDAISGDTVTGGPTVGGPAAGGPAAGSRTTVASGSCKNANNGAAPVCKITFGSIFMSLIFSYIANKR